MNAINTTREREGAYSVHFIGDQQPANWRKRIKKSGTRGVNWKSVSNEIRGSVCMRLNMFKTLDHKRSRPGVSKHVWSCVDVPTPLFLTPLVRAILLTSLVVHFIYF